MTLNWDYDDNGVALRSQSWIHANLVKPDAWPFLFCTLASLCVCVRAHVRMHVWICLQRFCLTNTLKKDAFAFMGFGPKGGRSPVEHTRNLYIRTYIYPRSWLRHWGDIHTYVCMYVQIPLVFYRTLSPFWAEFLLNLKATADKSFRGARVPETISCLSFGHLVSKIASVYFCKKIAGF